MFFKDRSDAGKRMADIVISSGLTGKWDVVGIARGGVVIAAEISKALNVGIKSICVEEAEISKKSIIAVSSLGSGILFQEGLRSDFIPIVGELNGKIAMETAIKAREKQLKLAGRDNDYGKRILLCDDGVVSGRTLITAVRSLMANGALEIIAVIPVILPWVANQKEFRVISWRTTKMTNPTTGVFYYDFRDVPDEDVMLMLKEHQGKMFFGETA